MRLVHNSMHDEVAAQLRDLIFNGALMPGTFLDEARIAEQLRISRRRNKAKVGKTVRVLFEGESNESELLWQGRMETQAPDIDGLWDKGKYFYKVPRVQFISTTFELWLSRAARGH